MKNFYIKLMQSSKALAFVIMTMLFAFGVNAQTITINSVTSAPYYTFGDIDVDYTAAGYPAGTTFYLVVDRNNNGFLDAEDDAEDYVLASSTSLTGVLEGEIPNMTGNLNFYVVAGEDGSLGEVVTEFSETAANLTTSGTVSFAYPLSMDQDMTERSIETPDYDLTSDDYYILVLDVDATDVVPANDLVVEVSQDNGATYSALTDQQGNNSFSASNGELIFALSQTLNTTSVRFRISQNNSTSIAAATETWTLTSADVIEYSGTFVQYNEQFTGTLSINAPTFTINAETYDTYIGEDVEVDYSALGFTSGATYYLYNGTILDPENRTIFDTDVSVNSILASTWPLDMGDQNVDVRIAGIYGNIDEPLMEFENSDLTITGSSSSAFSYQFSDEGVRSARTDALDLSGEDYVTFSVTANPVGTFSSDNAILVQYSTDGSTWVDLEDDNGVDEITSDTETTYEYTLPNAAKTSSTRIRVRQKAINLSGFSSYWFLSDMRIAFYTVGADQFVSNPFVSNYSVTVSSIEDADDAVISGGTAYPGDEITVTADAAGFDVNSEDYTVLINNTFLLDNEDVSIDGVTDEIVITGNIPTDVEYANASDIEIKIYDGDQPLVAVNENVFGDYNEEEDITVVGDDEVMDGDTKVEFSLAGDRSLTTPAFEIASTDDLTLSFFLNRTNSVRSPSGTEVVVEYSTDGETFTEIQSYSINEAGQAGETYEIDNTVLPSGMASATTSIRFRQASNNGLDLDAWELQNITLMGGTNVSDPGYINYNGLSLDILEPAITLTAIDNANLDLYPTTDFDVEFSVEGEFPAGTTYDVMLVRSLEGSFNLGTFSAGGTNSVTVPAVVAGTYDLVVVASYRETESNTVDLVVGEVMIDNVEITSTDAITDGNEQIVYAGNQIDITYEVVGDVGSGAVMNLEIYDNDPDVDDYMTIVEGEAIDGTISATLPIGIDYNSNDASFKLTITNGNLSGFVSFSQNWNNSTTNASEVYFPADLREGHSSSNYWSNGSGVRSATSIPFDFASGGEITLDLRLLSTGDYVFDQEVSLQYSIDEGDTWVEFETATIENSFADIFSPNIEIPEEAWMGDVLIRWIYNEDESVTGNQNRLYFAGFDIENYEKFPIAEEDFTLKPDLILEELSVSQSTLEDNDFILGEEFVVEYNAEGPFPADTEFAIVLEQGGEYVTLAETDQAGAVQQTVNIPSFPFEDTDLPYNLKVIPFKRVGSSDVFRAAAETETIEEEGDILEIEGRATLSTGSSGFSDFEFDQKGDRSLLTRAYDLEDFGTAKLNFSFTWYDGDYTTLLSLVELQVSTDGGSTFETLEVTDAMFEAEGLVFPTGAYSVEIPEAYLTAATHFKWVQQLNLGFDEDTWRVYNIDVVKGETNELNNQIYTTFNNPQTINITPPGISNYTWEQSDESDAVFNGETFNYNWDFDPNRLDESDFPAGTEYVFTIDEEDPETGENIVIATTSMLGSDLEASIPSYVENGTYNVLLTATIADGDEEYFLFEDEDVADLDVFLRTIVTNYIGEENDVIYAGNTVTFGITVENDETNAVALDDLFATLVAKSFSGSNDLIVATQEGVEDMTVDLPPYLNGDYDFEIRLSEDAPLGNVGDLVDVDDANTGETLIPGDFTSGEFVTLVETNDFWEYFFSGQDVNRNFNFDFEIDPVLAASGNGNERLRFQYSTDGGNNWSTWFNTSATSSSSSVNLNNFMTSGFNNPSGSSWERVRFRWVAYDPWNSSEPQARGSQIEISNVEIVGYSTSMENNTSFFPNGGSTSGPAFDDEVGRGLITTRDFSADELESSTLVSFDFSFGEILEDIGAGQTVIFEYSTDGGSSYTELDEIPSQALYDEEFDGVQTVLDNQKFTYVISSDMQENGARFRFRQEERNSIEVAINNMEILSGRQLPFDYTSVERDISKQTILVTGISSSEACLTDDIVIDYEIRGTMGSENIVTARYEEVGNDSNADDFSVELNVTSGTGQITVSLPSEVFGDGENNKFFRFGLSFDDDTNDDNNISGEGAISEQQLEVVAPIDQDQNFSVASGNNLECEGEDVIMRVSSPRDYFMYEVLDASDDSVLGSLSYDPENPEDEISLGVIGEDVILNLRITSMSSAGSECNTLLSSVTREVVLLENYVLNVNDNDIGNGYQVVESGDGKTFCEGSSANATLRVIRPDGTTAFSGVEWFRNDLNNPLDVSTSYQVSNNELSEAGSYFARVTDGSCSYITESYVIENVDAPEVPEITVTGDLGTCDGDGEVMLEATDGYTYYSWNTGETTRSITVADEGNYYVDVSNVPFEVGCSERSETVELETTYSQEFTINSQSQDAFLQGGETVTDCDETTIRFYNETYTSLQTANGGLYTAYRDGVAFKTGTGNTMTIDQSGEYYFEWTNDALNGVCTTTSPIITINIAESIEEMPVVTVVSGDLNFCEGEGEVVLEAPEGFAYYKWSTGETTRSITREVAGTVTVQVSNVPFDAGCASPSSAPIVIETSNLPDFVVSTDNFNPQPDDYLFDGAEYSECDDFRLYFYDLDASTSPRNDNGEVVINRGGEFYASTQNTSYVFEESGEYSIEWVSSDLSSTCSASAGSFSLTITESIDTAPTISTTDDLTFCEGGTATLTAQTGFNFYRWYNGTSLINTNSSTLVVDSSGDYTVEVSNTPFTVGCGSPRSNGIRVTVYNDPNINLETNFSSSVLSGGETIDVCSDDGFALRADNTGGNPVTWYLDDVVVTGSGNTSSTNRSDYAPLASGVYYAEVTVGGSDVADQCVFRTPSVTVNFSQRLDAPTISTSDDLSFCEGGTATLTADAGFSYYRWYNGNSLINTNSATLVVDSSGDYAVEVSNTPFTMGCGSPRSNGIGITVYNDPNMNLETNFSGSALSDGEVIDVCSDDGFVLRADNTGGNPVTWYLDGAALPGSSSNTGNTNRSDYKPTVSGAYFAEVTIGGSNVADQCVYRTPSVTVNVSQKLDVATIAAPATTIFCEGEVDVTLAATGPTEAVVYRWYRSDVNSSSFSAITDGTGNGNTIQITGEGKYYVTVGVTDGCESDPSNVITIESQSLANPNISVSTFDANCSNGGVTVQLTSTNAETVYQLINQETGANVGSPKTGSTSDPVYIQLTGVTESFGVMVQASYADGTGCPQTSTGSRGTVTPDNVMLELDGNELQAVISGSFIDYTWFRDDVKLKNVTGTTLRITDAAIYSIEVVFVGGCSVTSNSIDLTNESAGAGGGAGGIQGSAYPNPASGVVNVAIEGENMGDYDISIMTLSGQLMMSKTLSKEDKDYVEQLDIQSLQPGIYNLLIRKGNETKSMRIVKTQ